MSETLSKDEVDALLRGMDEGEVAVGEETAPASGVRPYDLVGEERLARRRFPALELVYERFLRRLRPSLASVLGTPPALALGQLEMLRFETFRNRLPAGASIHVFTMTPLRGQAALALSPGLAFGLVDRVCGGAGRAPAVLEAREPSTIEAQVLQRVARRALADFADAWTPVHRLECGFVRTELRPAYLALTGAAEMVLVREIGCDLGSGPAPLVVAIPYATLEPLRAKLGEPQAAAAGGSDREWLAAISAAVRQADVTVSAELGGCEVAARQVLGWRPGDVLDLGTRGDDPVQLRIEGAALLAGLAGVSRGQNAVRVIGRAPGE